MSKKILSSPLLSPEHPSPIQKLLISLPPESHQFQTFLPLFFLFFRTGQYLTLFLDFHLPSTQLFTISFTTPFLTLPHSSTAMFLRFHTSDLSNPFSCVFSLLCVFYSVCSSGSASPFIELFFSGGLSQATLFNLLVESSSFRVLSLFQYHPANFLTPFPSFQFFRAQVTFHPFLGLVSSSLYTDSLHYSFSSTVSNPPSCPKKPYH